MQSVKRVGVHDPKGHCVRRVLGHDDVPADYSGQIMHKRGAIDWVGPRLRLRKGQRVSLPVVIAGRLAFSLNKPVEHGSAHSQLFGRARTLNLVCRHAEFAETNDF